MAAKKSATLDFTRQYLKRKPDASFAEIRDAAAAEGMKIYPIVFGRAKALEGLVAVAPYGSKKRQREAAARAKAEAEAGRALQSAAGQATAGQTTAGLAAAGLPPSRPVSTGPAAASQPIDTIDAMIRGVRENLDERERYRAALIKISEILDDLL